MNLRSILFLSALGFIGFAKADNLATWTFETSQPATAGPFLPESGLNTATSSALGFHANTSTYSTPVGNGSAHSFSSNGWTLGDYYQFSTPTLGYSSLAVSYDQAGSNTGPANFNITYSIDGTNFTSIAGNAYTLASASFTSVTSNPAFTHSFNFSTITALNNAARIYFRVTDTSTTAITGGTVATAGTDRVDNFAINGTVIAPQATPEPSAFAALGVGAIALLRRRRKA